MKILVVDDDPIQRSIITAALTASGNMVQSVGSGEAAIEMLTNSDELDMILMDMRMPGGISGQEATERIRKLVGWRGQVRIVAMSAAELLDHDRMAAKFDGFLSKDGPGFQIALATAVADGAAAADKEAPRSPLMTWMRANVALTGLLVGFLSGGSLGIWKASAALQHQFDILTHGAERLTDKQKVLDQQQTVIGGRIDGVATRLDGIGHDIADIDRRLNDLRHDQANLLVGAKGLLEQETALGARLDGMGRDMVDVDHRLNDLKSDARVSEERIRNIGERTQKRSN